MKESMRESKKEDYVHHTVKLTTVLSLMFKSAHTEIITFLFSNLKTKENIQIMVYMPWF
jgi:hypothetical protein